MTHYHDRLNAGDFTPKTDKPKRATVARAKPKTRKKTAKK